MILSVALSSYNHSRYLIECLDGIYRQETDFEFELVIYDDLSTDNSRQVIEEYISSHSNKSIAVVRTIFPDTNSGILQGPLKLIDSCRGEYTALIEGDDYWTSPHKLQRQLDFLRSRPGYTLCYHTAAVYNQQLERITGLKNREPFDRTVTTEEIIIGSGSSIPTCSIMFLSSALRNRPQWYESMPVGDYPMFLLLALKGCVYHFTEPMSVYRLNLGSGSWSAVYLHEDNFNLRFNLHTAIIRCMEMMNADTGGKYARAVKIAASKRCLSLLNDNYDDSFRKQYYADFKNRLIPYDRVTLFIEKHLPFPRYFKKMIKMIFSTGRFCRKAAAKTAELI